MVSSVQPNKTRAVLLLNLYKLYDVLCRVQQFISDMRFTLCCSWRLYWHPKHRIHVVFDELQNVTPSTHVACIHPPPGASGDYRKYIINDPSLVLPIVSDRKHFEKIEAEPSSLFGNLLGYAITNSGDHPVHWRVAKSLMRSIVSSNYTQTIVYAMKEGMMASAGRQWTAKHNHVVLFRELLRISVPVSFHVLFERDLVKELQAYGIALDEFLRLIDLLANTSITVLEHATEMERTMKAFTLIVQTALREAPPGTFGHNMQALIDNQDDASEFTAEMGVHNAFFYVVAMPMVLSVVLHWTAYCRTKYPQQAESVRTGLENGDSTQFLMFLKEVLRLYPPVTSFARRLVKTNVNLGGTTLTKGGVVYVVPAFLIGDQSFQPERWQGNLNLSDAIFGGEDGKLFYAPFSTGTRGCLGHFIMEPLLREVSADFFLNFDFELEGADPWAGKPTAFHHFPDNLITFKPERDLLFTVTSKGGKEVEV